MEQIEQSYKKSKNIIGIIQSCLILLLIVLIIFIMVNISRLQGTARVINYAGLVRGATQREVKLEITGNQNDELIKYLDDILSGLRYQDGHYDLVKLNDEEYLEKLQIQSDYWDKLKKEIEAVRNKGYENTDIVNMSEIYFTMADETVSAAESYSEKIAVKIRTIELLSALDMLSLVILVIMQTLRAMQMAMQNRLLEQKAFIDAHTGLPNKNACNELLDKKDMITGEDLKAGDVLIGMASSGVHSNGFSLVRKVFEMTKENLETYHESLGCTLGEALLAPTRIYVKALKSIKAAGVTVKACSHITGGGFYENIPRMLKEGTHAVIEKDSYPVLPIFDMLAKEGDIEEQMMYNTFNMGLGMVLAVDAADVEKTMEAIKAAGDTPYVVGKIEAGEKGVTLC